MLIINVYTCTITIFCDVGDELVEECIVPFTAAHIGEQGSSSEKFEVIIASISEYRMAENCTYCIAP